MSEIPLPDMPDGPSPEEVLINGLIKRYAQLAAQMLAYGAEVEAIKARLRKLGPGRHEYAAGKVTITPQKRFNAELAAKVLTEINPDLVAACSEPKLTSSLVKKLVGDDVYERCQEPSGEDKVAIA